MRLDLAMGLRIGDVVFNAVGKRLIIEHYDSTSMVFSAVDTRLCSSKYMLDDIYLEDLYGESDEEKSFVHWIRDNKVADSDILYNKFNLCFSLMKQTYKQGYAMGFHSKRQYSYEEQMQK